MAYAPTVGSLRARDKEIAAKLKQEELEVKRIEYWDDEGNKV